MNAVPKPMVASSQLRVHDLSPRCAANTPKTMVRELESRQAVIKVALAIPILSDSHDPPEHFDLRRKKTRPPAPRSGKLPTQNAQNEVNTKSSEPTDRQSMLCFTKSEQVTKMGQRPSLRAAGSSLWPTTTDQRPTTVTEYEYRPTPSARPVTARRRGLSRECF